MKRLWAPWRIEYIKSPKEDACFFCKYLQENKDDRNLVLYRGKSACVVMNYYPYNNGHLMIAPYQHTSEINELDNVTKLEIMNLIAHCQEALTEMLHAQGFNVGINIGEVAGAGLKEHLHIHVVPRWNGDTNFMPVSGHAKVISQGLRETWETLRNYFEKLPDN
ncbi:MAG: HIT domain-containing protein [Candidatus Marinimicrobia bacterium]|nr:HIT domain-containing protein [Candidatus Neomarinimicrobiota bacterium]